MRAYMSTGVEVGHELFGSDPGELVFECFEFFPEGLNIVERDLDSVAVDFAEGVHFSLFLPCSPLSLS